MKLKLSQIRIDGGTQPRTQLNEATVAEYAEAMTEGANLPPVSVFFDGSEYWLADGFHRFHAHNKIGALTIEATAHQGTRRDAILFSVGANASHGLRRTNDDKRRAVLTLLEDQEWAKWSDNQVAKSCGVSHPFVGQVRRSLETVSSEPRSYTTKHGTEAVMNTENIGKKAEGKQPKTKRQLDARPDDVPEASNDDGLAEAQHTIAELAAENESLRDRLAVEQMDASEEGKAEAAATISELRERVRTLEAENDALKASRDTYMQKVSEMQKQIAYWRKQAEKAA